MGFPSVKGYDGDLRTEIALALQDVASEKDKYIQEMVRIQAENKLEGYRSFGNQFALKELGEA